MAGYDLATSKDDGTWKGKLGRYGRIGGDLAGTIGGGLAAGTAGLVSGPGAIAAGIAGGLAGGYIGGKIGETAGEFIGSIMDFFSSGDDKKQEDAVDQFSEVYKKLSSVSKERGEAFIRTGIKKYIEENGSEGEEGIMDFISSISDGLPSDLKQKVFDIAKKEIIAA